MAEHVDTDHQGRVVGGRYAVTGELGRGGMGVVWRAWDQVIGREVAIKELHLPDGVPAEERQVYEERVLREARTAGRLNDPAVVTVHDVLAESGVTYIVMELVQAVTLGDLVARHGPLSPERVAGLARQVASALETAHAAGIVHRDIKPSNIMVDRDYRVKLADFGIAQTLDDPRLTTSGAIVGSPSFMAPERLRGGDATPASDLWSLGATLFFVLEGWMPFERQTTAATLHAVLHEPPQLSRPHGVVGSVVTGLLVADQRARLAAPQVRTLLDSSTVTAQQTGPNVAATAVRTGPPTWSLPGANRPKPVWTVVVALVAAVVLFGGGVLVGRLVLAPSKPRAMAPTLTYGRSGDIRFTGVGDGECATGALDSGSEITSEDVVSCDEPHDVEIYTYGDVFGSSASAPSYPGEQELNRYAEGLCSSFFSSDQIVTPGKQSVLRYVALVPSRRLWELRNRVLNDDNDDNDEQGHQTVYCAVSSAERGKLRGSVTSGS